MRFRVVTTARAQDDLERLFDFIVERELAREAGDVMVAVRAVEAIRRAVDTLSRTPLVHRKAAGTPTGRELVIRFAGAGYVALFEVLEEERIVVVAVRHQLEEGYAPQVPSPEADGP
jgi:plasmid stabilization system protein ParE